MFRRESSGSGGVVIGGVTDSETSTPVAATTPVGRVAIPKDKRSASIAGYITIDGGDTAGNPMLDPLGISRAGPHATAFPVTASHRRNNRRGSMLELSGLLVPGRRPSRYTLEPFPAPPLETDDEKPTQSQ
uniref:Uncharacterized protein n=1 Tax=Anopheles culicifacies TaxID=139723 RepID=A0A182M280_9DIPT